MNQQLLAKSGMLLATEYHFNYYNKSLLSRHYMRALSHSLYLSNNESLVLPMQILVVVTS